MAVNNKRQMEDKMTGDIKVRELLGYCMDTDQDLDVHIYINEVPVGFPIKKLDYDFDGSLKLHIKDKSIKINEAEL